jgi:putative ABC transport system permease protein
VRLWEILKIAADGVRRTPLRVALTALGVAIACGSLVCLVAFALGLQSNAETPFRKLDLLSRIDVGVKGAALERRGTARDAPPPDAPLLDEAALDRIRALPGVELAYPETMLAGVEIAFEGKTQRTLATGLPREAAKLPFVRDLLVAGEYFGVGGANEVLLGRGLARNLGFEKPEDALGKTVSLTASGLSPSAALTFTFERRQVELRVAGVVDPMGFGFGPAADAMILPLDLLRDLPGIRLDAAMQQLRGGRAEVSDGYARVVVRVSRPSDAAPVEEKIRALGYETRTLLTQLTEMRTFFVVIDLLLAAVGTVALVVAGLGIINTLLMAVLERTREIGTLKALGASDGDVRTLFLAEAALVGLLGGAGGLALGVAVSRLIDFGVNQYARRQGIEQAIAVFQFPSWLFLGAVAFAVAVSVASGVYPASHAARIDPIRALRGE